MDDITLRFLASNGISRFGNVEFISVKTELAINKGRMMMVAVKSVNAMQISPQEGGIMADELLSTVAEIEKIRGEPLFGYRKY